MNAVELNIGDKPCGVWMCEKCRRLNGSYMGGDAKAMAERCCRPYICTGGCGAELPYEKHRMRCDDCCRKDQQAKELKAYENAKKLKPSEWDGPVFDRNDNFFMSLDDYFERYHDDEDVREEQQEGTWVWCAREIKFSPSVDNMIENALDNHHEDAADRISTAEMKELEDFVAAWAEKTGVISYEPDGKSVVLIESETNK